jgi:polyferredoxin
MRSLVSADAVLIFHAFYVSVVVFGVPLIIIGGLRQWRWVYNIWFRLIHVLMIATVVAESFLGINCPLTIWENILRATGKQPGYADRDFIASWLDRILFYHFPHWVFTTVYAAFGFSVVALLFIVPVRRN